MLLTYFLNDFEIVPVAPIINGITFVFIVIIICLLLLLLLLLLFVTTFILSVQNYMSETNHPLFLQIFFLPPPPMPPHVLMNIRGFPPGCGDSVADF